MIKFRPKFRRKIKLFRAALPKRDFWKSLRNNAVSDCKNDRKQNMRKMHVVKRMPSKLVNRGIRVGNTQIIA